MSWRHCFSITPRAKTVRQQKPQTFHVACSALVNGKLTHLFLEFAVSPTSLSLARTHECKHSLSTWIVVILVGKLWANTFQTRVCTNTHTLTATMSKVCCCRHSRVWHAWCWRKWQRSVFKKWHKTVKSVWRTSAFSLYVFVYRGTMNGCVFFMTLSWAIIWRLGHFSNLKFSSAPSRSRKLGQRTYQWRVSIIIVLFGAHEYKKINK